MKSFTKTYPNNLNKVREEAQKTWGIKASKDTIIRHPLRVYAENNPQTPLENYFNIEDIARKLKKVKVTFERWQAKTEITDDADNETIIAAYRQDIDRIIATSGYQTFDVISMNENHPQKTELRQKFLSEHIHDDDEIRFFIKGKGLFFSTY